MSTPFLASWEAYCDAGWSPVPTHRDTGNPAPGYTGAEGEWVTVDTRFDLDPASYPNVAVRPPGNAIGLDVDDYARDGHQKTGAITLAILEAQLGRLPATARSSARPAPSGILWFRLPDGVTVDATAEEKIRTVGDYVDVIRTGHRFARCWPTPKGETGTIYRWFGPSGEQLPDGIVPPVDRLPELPEAWVEFLTTPPEKAAPAGNRYAPGAGDADGTDWFTEDEAQAFLAPHLAAIRDTPWGQGRDYYNVAYRAACAIRNLEGLWSQEELVAMMVDALVEGHGVEPSRNDLEHFNNAFKRPSSKRPRLVTEADRRNAFTAGGRYYAGPTRVPGDGSRRVERLHVMAEAGGSADDEVPGDDGRSSLWGDVAAMIRGGVSKPKPSVLSRTDGKPMFYARAVNAVFGDPESGKTWIVLAALAETLLHGGRAAFIDMDHNGMASVIDRLRLLGVPDEILMDQALFKYAEPEDGQDLDQMIVELRRIEAEITGWCDSAEGECHDVTVIGVDSIGELVPMYGGNSNDADDYTAVHRRVLTALAKSGACVIAVDHQAKGQDSRSYGAAGSMAKKRTVDGSYLLVENARPFVPGKGGSATLAVFKDRHGGLREHCPEGKSAEAGTFALAAPEAAEGNAFGVQVAPWSVIHPGAKADRDPGHSIDVKLRAEIVAFIVEKSSTKTVSGKQIVDNVAGNSDRKRDEPKAMAEGPHAVLTMDVGGPGKPTVFGLTAEIDGSARVRNIRQIVEDYYAALTVLQHTGRGPASFRDFVEQWGPGWTVERYREAS